MLRDSIIILACFVIGLGPRVRAELRDHVNWPRLEAECGISDDSNRIIGGVNAEPGQYPWQARIGYLREMVWHRKLNMRVQEYLCGGVLISLNQVLTAAHCLVQQPGVTLNTLQLGQLNVDDCTETKCKEFVQKFFPSRILYPNNYGKPAQFKNDIGLIKLDRNVVINDWVRPICLPHSDLLDKDFVGEYAEITGWGVSNSSNGEVPKILKVVKVPILPVYSCADIFPTFLLDEKQICAGGELDKDSCGGDSGGPMQKVENSEMGPRYFLIGLVSFGATECGKLNSPAIYTRVTAFMDWILENLHRY